MPEAPASITWIRPLAAPYLRGFRPVAQRTGSLRGYWFLHPPGSPPPAESEAQKPARARTGGRETVTGFFVGYLVHSVGFDYLKPQPPECLTFAFVSPPGGLEHRSLVSAPDSLLRKTFEYIRWLTHRPPRFVFAEGELAAMTRHQSMREWPAEKYVHFSRNFFIEALAWLIRSGLVKRLQSEIQVCKPVAQSAGKRQAKKRSGFRPRAKH